MAVLFDLLIVSRASSSSVMSSSSSVSSLETTVSFPSVTATASSISVSWPAVGQQIDALLSLPPERLKQLLLIAMDRLQTDDPDSSHPSSSSVPTSALLTGGVIPTAHSVSSALLVIVGVTRVLQVGFSQGSYNGHLYLGDLRRLMNGMLNIYRLRHGSRRFDCAINSFR